MNTKRASIDLVKLAVYILKRAWLLVICAAIGFGFMYSRAIKRPDTYTAYGTMFVTNSNPNLVNYGYANTADFSSAVQLVNIYSEVIKSQSVMERVLEYQTTMIQEDGTEGEVLLNQKYPWLTVGYVRGTVSMASVNQTPMVRVSCTTMDPVLSTDICNAVLQVAPAAIIEVVGAGYAKPQDYPEVPRVANARNDRRQGMTGALTGMVVAAALLFLLFLRNQRVEDPSELTDNYTLPILSKIRRRKEENKDPGSFLLKDRSEMDLMESYAKLRMNVLYTLVGKERRTILVTSAISGEGKSTIAASLAVSFAMSEKKVLLIDADMRRACQSDIFHYDSHLDGLSEILAETVDPADVILPAVRENLDILPSGSTPPNPSELLGSQAMHELLDKLEKQYDLILLDVPPINIVSDPLALSSEVAGGIMVVRQHFTDHREVRTALVAAEMTGLNLLGFVFYGEKLHQGSYYSRKYYRGYRYYHKYDTRSRTKPASRRDSGRSKDSHSSRKSHRSQ